jgi:acylpyruvate hydrolase
MRLATVRLDGRTHAARVEGDTATVLLYDDVGVLLAEPEWRDEAEKATGRVVSIEDVEFAPVVPRPEKIICVGLNHAMHAAETGHELPPYPQLFAKYWRSLIGARDDIQLPGNSDSVDWEAEVGVIIGSPVRNATETEAHAAIAGYTVVNDISMRDWQRRTGQYLQGKTFEAATPVGPALVTTDESGDLHDLKMTCEVNGMLMQEVQAGDMVFSPTDVIRYVSSILTLSPGDLIAMGTPGGIGARRKPPVFLSDGDHVRTAIEGIGALENVCRRS